MKEDGMANEFVFDVNHDITLVNHILVLNKKIT
jgi:hypothetical protein